MRKIFIAIISICIPAAGFAQQNQESGLKREITLYNPYKPSLPVVVKKSFLPNVTDTARIRHDFTYEVKTTPFMPPYNISPLRPASLIPDPLPKLYNSYVNIGIGNYVTPLAEVSITNERSKKGAIGLYARHFSTNGKVELQNLEKVFAGYMDNDVSIFGRKFMRRSIFDGSVDFSQITRYAYGYDTSFTDYNADKKDIKRNFFNTGAGIGLTSVINDSSKLAYDFDLDYRYFYAGKYLSQNSLEFKGEMSKQIKEFYAGSGAELDFYKPSDSISVNAKYIAAVTPFIAKNTSEWSVRLGFQALVDKGLADPAKLHLYPDVNFSFNIVRSYVSFFAGLTGFRERNEPVNVIRINPFLLPGKTLFELKNTDYSLIVTAGFKGETGIDGSYRLSASYSLVNDMLLFSNYIETDGPAINEAGNNFIPLYDQAEILNVHGDLGGQITDKLAFKAGTNYYRYTLAENDFAWNRPSWDASFGLKYNLRDKILGGISIDATGKRNLLVTSTDLALTGNTYQQLEAPVHFNISLAAEYRYTKILSFWIKFNNISASKYYEWAYYPSQRFLCLVGFTYSL